jgi:hypothetical protein
MISHRVFLGAFAALSLPLSAIPNQVGGFIAQVDSPLNDTDMTDVLLGAGIWAGNENLPGIWRDEAPIATVASSYLAARPKVLGLPAIMVQARHRTGTLDSLAITFADAGSYFGYFNEKLPPGLSERKKQEELRRRVADRRLAFSKFFSETEASLKDTLKDLADGRPRESQIGKTRTLRAEVTDYQKGDLLLRLIVGGDRLIRVLVIPKKNATRQWLDSERASLSGSALGRVYQDRVTKFENGDVRIDNLPIVPQGYKPYCGLNTLTMAARYFGLHIDEDWLAVAGKFENTGSAKGSQIPRLYLAVAKEAGLDLHKSNDFALTDAKSSLDRGLPVVVWRRFSQERNQLHTKQTMQAARDPKFALPSPDTATRDSWPNDKAPLHASVIVGYNADRSEVLFVESWAGMKIPRRMRAEEMAATAYLTFYFKP